MSDGGRRMTELGLRSEPGLRDAEAPGRALLGGSVQELIDRFNKLVQAFDMASCREIIASLFKVDCYDDDSAQALDVQRTDLLCQCLETYSLALLVSRRAAMPQPSIWIEDWKDLLGATPLPHSADRMDVYIGLTHSDAAEHQAAVCDLCRRHTASQRFRRTWLKEKVPRDRQLAGGAALLPAVCRPQLCSSASSEMQRFDAVLLLCFLIETQLRLVEAWAKEFTRCAWINASKNMPFTGPSQIDLALAKEAFEHVRHLFFHGSSPSRHQSASPLFRSYPPNSLSHFFARVNCNLGRLSKLSIPDSLERGPLYFDEAPSAAPEPLGTSASAGGERAAARAATAASTLASGSHSRDASHAGQEGREHQVDVCDFEAATRLADDAGACASLCIRVCVCSLQLWQRQLQISLGEREREILCVCVRARVCLRMCMCMCVCVCVCVLFTAMAAPAAN